MPNDTYPLPFPIKGLYESTGFDGQPAGTTNDALNVRAFCALAGRARGGSRAGTSKYTYGRVTNLQKPIQNMVKAVEGASYPSAYTTLVESFQGYTAEVSPNLSPLWCMGSTLAPLAGVRVHPALWETTIDGIEWRKSSDTTGGQFVSHCLPLVNDAESTVTVVLRAKSQMDTGNNFFGTADEASMVGPFIKASIDLTSGYAAIIEPSATNFAVLHIIRLVPGVDGGYESVASEDIGLLNAGAGVTDSCEISLWTTDESSGSIIFNARINWPGGGASGTNIDRTIRYTDTNPGLLFLDYGAGVGIFNRRGGTTNPTFIEGTSFRTIKTVEVRYRTPATRLIVQRWLPTEEDLNQYFRPIGLSTITHDAVDYTVQPTDRYDSASVDTNEVFADTAANEYVSAYSTDFERSAALTRPWDAGGPFDLEVVLSIPTGMTTSDTGKTQFWFRVNADDGYLVRVEVQFVIDHTDSAGNETARISLLTLSSIGEDGETLYGGAVSVPIPFVSGAILRVEDRNTDIAVYLSGREVGVFPFPLQTGVNALLEFFPNDRATGDGFGGSVGIADGVIIVGAIGNDDNGVGSGSAYLFNAATRTQIAKLLPSDGAANNQFGISVAIGSGVAVVGARGHNHSGVNSGSVYLFNATTGVQINELLPSDGVSNGYFGNSVAIEGTTVVVGAPWDDDLGADSGSVYLFNSITGVQTNKLNAGDGVVSDWFGHSVAIGGGIIAVGSPKDDDAGDQSGSVYLFDESTGLQTFKLTANDATMGDNFGVSLSISNGVLAVGAELDNHSGVNSGSVYLFNATTGVQITKLLPSDGVTDDNFGASVAISPDYVLVGAPLADVPVGVGNMEGAVYLFNTNTYTRIAKLTASDGEAGDNLGRSVAIDGTLAVLGCPVGDDSITLNAGSAYPFDLAPPSNAVPPNAEGTYAAISQGKGSGVGSFPEYVNYISEMRWVRSSGSQYNETTSGSSGRLLAVSDGSIVDVTEGLISPIPSGVDALDSSPFNIQSVAAFNAVFFTDGDVIKEYKLDTGSVVTPTPSAGVFPTDPRLLTLYRGRLVWSGTPDDPHNWFMSAAGDPLDYDYSPPTPTEIQAVAGNNSTAGLIGDVITALVPFGDDYMIFGCDSTIWQMTGDPAAGGVIDLVSDQTGMAFGKAWAKDPANTLYFWGNDGVYRLVPGGTPQNMTKNRIDFRLRSVALDQNRIYMEWDYLNAELIVLIHPADSSDPVRVIVWEARTDAWWEDSYPSLHGPHTILAYNSTAANDQALLLGGRDGFIRKIDRTVGTDDSTAIPSRVRFAPFIAPSRTSSVLLNTLHPVLAKGSSVAAVKVYTGQTAEGCATATTPRISQALTHAGRNALIRRPIRGFAVQVEIDVPAGTVPWALESMIAKFDLGGLPTRHARVASEGAANGD